MKSVLIVFCLVAIGGCVYDPPLKGNEIVIHNQTDQSAFVIDSLPSQGNARLFDTSLVNERKLIATSSNNIPAFSSWTYFLSENRYRFQKHINNGRLTLYFIAEKDIHKSYDEIKRDKLYRVFYVDADSVLNNGLNHIFYYTDTTILEHRFDTEKYR